MGKKTISVCEACGRKTCDGGIWKIIGVTRISDGANTLLHVHPDNIRDCTMLFFGRDRCYNGAAIGQIAIKTFHNWAEPSTVTLERIS